MVLILIRAARKQLRIVYQSCMPCAHVLCVGSHQQRKNVPVDLITLLNLSDTHPRCKEFLGQSFVLKSVGFHNPIKCNKLKSFVACEVKKKLMSSQN